MTKEIKKINEQFSKAKNLSEIIDIIQESESLMSEQDITTNMFECRYEDMLDHSEDIILKMIAGKGIKFTSEELKIETIRSLNLRLKRIMKKYEQSK